MNHNEFRNIFAGNPDRAMDNDNYLNEDNGNLPDSLWVFGYGSLCWNPGFNYSKCVTGYIRGFVRRFWQGNTAHRGTEQKPGRVATLVKDDQGITWGCAYKITGGTALEYLKQRECTLGGYITIDTKFFPRIASGNNEITGEAFPVLVYIATDRNCHWLGDGPLNHIAEQIAESSGPSGHNAEYLLRLASFMRDEIPGAIDDHLFILENYVREILDKRKVSLSTVMGPSPRFIRRDSHENVLRPSTFEFASRVPERRLRCLNI